MMPLFPKTGGEAEEQEDFITLVRVAEEDVEVRSQIASILKLESFHRQSLLNSWIEELHLKKAPDELIRALSCLLDDDVAEKTMRFFKNRLQDNM